MMRLILGLLLLFSSLAVAQEEGDGFVSGGWLRGARFSHPTSLQLHVADDIKVSFGNTKGDPDCWQAWDTSGTHSMILRCTDVDGVGTDGNVWAIATGTDDLRLLGDLLFTQAATAYITHNSATRTLVINTADNGSGGTGWLNIYSGDATGGTPGSIAFSVDGAPGTGTDVLSMDSSGYVYIGDNVSGSKQAARFDTSVDNELTIANESGGALTLNVGTAALSAILELGVEVPIIGDSGDGNPAAYTLTPATSNIDLTCNDGDGCDITMGESGIATGHIVEITTAGTNVCNFADTAGVSELAGAFAMGQYDSLTLKYRGDRWIESSRSDN